MTIREQAEAVCADLYPSVEVLEKDSDAVKDEMTAFFNWAMRAHGTDKIEAAIRSAGEPLAAALHMLLRGYEPDRDKEEQIKERLWTAAAALAAWEAK